MSIFNRMSRQYVRENFTHEGWFYMCPVYAVNVNSPAPTLIEKNWVPEFWLTFSSYLVQTINLVLMTLGGDGRDFTLCLKKLED